MEHDPPGYLPTVLDQFTADAKDFLAERVMVVHMWPLGTGRDVDNPGAHAIIGLKIASRASRSYGDHGHRFDFFRVKVR